MSSKKDEQNEQQTTPTTIPFSSERQQQEIREAILNAFDEAKDKTQRAVKEAKKEIPRYTEAVHSYQEKTIEIAREIAENHIDSQKEIIKLLQQSSWVQLLREQAYRTLWPNWISSKRTGEMYADMVSNYVDNNFAAVKLCNDVMLVNGEVLKNSMSHARENAKVFSKITLDNAKIFERIFGAYLKISKDSTASEIERG